MTLGTILGASFRVLRRNPRPVVGFSLIIHAILAVVGILVTGNAVTTLTNALSEIASGSPQVASQIGPLLLADLAEFAVIALGLVANQILQGIISQEVASGTVGERLPLRALWARARGRILVLIGWAIALVAALLVFVVVLSLLVALIAVASAPIGNGGGIAIAILSGVFLFLGGLVLVLWIGIKLSLVPSILVIERLTLGRAMSRSWSLTRGFFWRTLGIELLVWIMLLVATDIASTPVVILLLVVNEIAHPTGSSAASDQAGAWLSQAISTIFGELVATVTSIVSTASTALIYLDLRIRKEGLDLRLMRFVDARSAGTKDVPNPYLVVPVLPTADSVRAGAGVAEPEPPRA